MDDAYGSADSDLLIEAGLSDLVDALGAERRAQIFMQRYGLIDGRSHTLEEIALVHGVSRERIRQLLVGIHRRVRSALTRARAKDPDRPLVQLADAVIQVVRPPGGQWDIHRAADVAVQWFGHLSYYSSAQLLLLFFPTDKALISELQVAIKQALAREQAAKRAAQRLHRRVEVFLKDVRFPGGTRLYTPEELGPLLRARAPRDVEGFPSEKLQRHVRYDSRLEWQVLQSLERQPEVRVYQEQPLAIAYHHAGRERRYYPDVLVHLMTGHVVLIEIKPVQFMAASINLSKWAAMKALCAERGYGLLVLDGQYTLLDVLRRAGNTDDLARRLQALIAEYGELDYATYRKAMGTSRPHITAFTAAVMRHRIPFQVYPFRLGGVVDDRPVLGST